MRSPSIHRRKPFPETPPTAPPPARRPPNLGRRPARSAPPALCHVWGAFPRFALSPDPPFRDYNRVKVVGESGVDQGPAGWVSYLLLFRIRRLAHSGCRAPFYLKFKPTCFRHASDSFAASPSRGANPPAAECGSSPHPCPGPTPRQQRLTFWAAPPDRERPCGHAASAALGRVSFRLPRPPLVDGGESPRSRCTELSPSPHALPHALQAAARSHALPSRGPGEAGRPPSLGIVPAREWRVWPGAQEARPGGACVCGTLQTQRHALRATGGGEWPMPFWVSRTCLCGLRPLSQRCTGLRRGPKLGHAESLVQVSRWEGDGSGMALRKEPEDKQERKRAAEMTSDQGTAETQPPQSRPESGNPADEATGQSGPGPRPRGRPPWTSARGKAQGP